MGGKGVREEPGTNGPRQYNYFSSRGCAAEKADEELYFVAKEGSESDDKTAGGKWKRKLKLLRSEANLQPDTRVPPFPGRKRQRPHSRKLKLKDGSAASLEDSGVGDSSSDEEYDQSVTFAQIRQQQQTMAATKERLQMKPIARDLWADSEGTMSHNSVGHLYCN